MKSNTISSRDRWATLKTVISLNSSTSIPPLQNEDSVISDDLDKANILNDFFRAQTLIDETNTVLSQLDPYIVDSNIYSLHFSPVKIESVLKSLKTGKATGPDGINNRILRELSKDHAVPFCSLFNQSTETGIFPQCWKVVHACLIFKNGDPSLPSNYRPVSLLCTPAKVMERAVFKYLYNHFNANNIITPSQSGFTPDDSTTHQLTFLYGTFCEVLDTGKDVRVVFCDISKAFDRVWHTGLLHKLQAAGVHGNLLRWFNSYLTNRKQCVVLPGVQSNVIVFGLVSLKDQCWGHFCFYYT